MLSDRAAFTTQSRSSLTGYAKKKSQMILRDYEIKEIVCDGVCMHSFSVNYGSVSRLEIATIFVAYAPIIESL